MKGGGDEESDPDRDPDHRDDVPLGEGEDLMGGEDEKGRREDGFSVRLGATDDEAQKPEAAMTRKPRSRGKDREAVDSPPGKGKGTSEPSR